MSMQALGALFRFIEYTLQKCGFGAILSFNHLDGGLHGGRGAAEWGFDKVWGGVPCFDNRS